AEERAVEELRLGEKAQLARGGATDEGRIEHARVVRDEQERPRARHVLGAAGLGAGVQAHEDHRERRPGAELEAQKAPRDGLQYLVEPRARSTASTSRSSTSASPSPVVSTTTA